MLNHSPNTIYINAANIIAILCYQLLRLLPARVVSVIITSYVNHLLNILLLFEKAPPRPLAACCFAALRQSCLVDSLIVALSVD